jgi:probable HAF family extracellular repeat protein
MGEKEGESRYPSARKPPKPRKIQPSSHSGRTMQQRGPRHQLLRRKRRIFLYSERAPHDPGKEHFAKALAVNGSGHSAGDACTTVTAGNCVDAEAVLRVPGGEGATVLRDATGDVGNYEALAINATDYSVGWAATSATGKDAVRWSPTGTATVLTGLKGSTFSEAVAENNLGLSIGYSDTATGDDAILWGPNGGIKAVLRDPGGKGGKEFAFALNDKGQSVGYADIAGGGTEAVLWQVGGKATNLGKLLGSDWSNTEAVGINNLGDIAGYGHYQKGTVSGTFGFLLTSSAAPGPVSAASAPELSTWAMLVVGFAGLGLAGYRGARKGEARPEGLA